MNNKAGHFYFSIRQVVKLMLTKVIRVKSQSGKIKFDISLSAIEISIQIGGGGRKGSQSYFKAADTIRRRETKNQKTKRKQDKKAAVTSIKIE